MATAQFMLGSEARCTDGPCGVVERIVIDPRARKVTHLMVEPAGRVGLGRLVPIELVELGLLGDEADRAAHGTRTIQGALRTAQNLDAIHVV